LDGWEVRRGNTWKTKIGDEAVTFQYCTRKRPPATGQFLTDHQSLARASARALATAIGPGNEFVMRLLSEAAVAHDEGKRHPPWQRAMGNNDLANPVAKPVLARPGSAKGYRHEWGSVLRIAEQSPSVPSDWDEATGRLWNDLLLYLIGAHHGYLRPSLPDRAFPRPPTMAKQVPLRMAAIERFVRLQQALGPWRLAYLEALLKAADVDASREPMEETNED
jgi:CRISPR-associated endonuclease/helicase Cas3